jgi:hypothetical protein
MNGWFSRWSTSVSGRICALCAAAILLATFSQDAKAQSEVERLRQQLEQTRDALKRAQEKQATERRTKQKQSARRKQGALNPQSSVSPGHEAGSARSGTPKSVSFGSGGKPTAKPKPAARTISLRGRWSTQKKCGSGSYPGRMTITRHSGSRFSGTYTSLGFNVSGRIVGARLSGKSVTFTVKIKDVFGAPSNQRWRGRLVSGGRRGKGRIRIVGSVVDKWAKCSFVATRR